MTGSATCAPEKMKTPDVAALIHLPRARFSDFPILKSILSIDDGAIAMGI